jgi:hypothetical protein
MTVEITSGEVSAVAEAVEAGAGIAAVVAPEASPVAAVAATVAGAAIANASAVAAVATEAVAVANPHTTGEARLVAIETLLANVAGLLAFLFPTHADAAGVARPTH